MLDCRKFKVSSSERQSTTGKRGTFFSVDAPDWAGVIPVVETPEGRSRIEDQAFQKRSFRIWNQVNF